MRERAGAPYRHDHPYRLIMHHAGLKMRMPDRFLDTKATQLQGGFDIHRSNEVVGVEKAVYPLDYLVGD